MQPLLIINNNQVNFVWYISTPLGGHWALGFILFITIAVHSPGLTTTEKGPVAVLNWFLSLYPEFLTCLWIENEVLWVDFE
jgi:hypothetical protein